MKLGISRLKPFTNHPFKKLSDDKLAQLADSISQSGLIYPIIVRPIDNADFDYEIVAGHNRVDATLLNGEDMIESDIRELSDEQSTIIMVDSNLQQREYILPSEKAWAYKAKLDALKSQGKRNDLTCDQLGHKLVGKKSIEIMAELLEDSMTQIKRYIRLTNLLQPLLTLVDDGKLRLTSAVELSYLDDSKQLDVLERMEFHGVYNLPLEGAKRIKEIAKYGDLTIEKIDHQCFEKPDLAEKSIKIKAGRINSFFDSKASPQEKEDIIVKALEMYYQRDREQKRYSVRGR